MGIAHARSIVSRTKWKDLGKKKKKKPPREHRGLSWFKRAGFYITQHNRSLPDYVSGIPPMCSRVCRKYRLFLCLFTFVLRIRPGRGWWPALALCRLKVPITASCPEPRICHYMVNCRHFPSSVSFSMSCY